MTDFEVKLLIGEYEGEEICPHCSRETHFTIVPLNEIKVKCNHCGRLIMPCSLCDHPYGCECGRDVTDCQKNIFQTLIEVNCNV